ncbi:hypothetical protein [Lentzea sp.]|uniref:hypothetical protein n=1 Tax=Lentzea sp. TaxID=56099 RepID=UPI002ED3753C
MHFERSVHDAMDELPRFTWFGPVDRDAQRGIRADDFRDRTAQRVLVELITHRFHDYAGHRLRTFGENRRLRTPEHVEVFDAIAEDRWPGSCHELRHRPPPPLTRPRGITGSNPEKHH